MLLCFVSRIKLSLPYEFLLLLKQSALVFLVQLSFNLVYHFVPTQYVDDLPKEITMIVVLREILHPNLILLNITLAQPETLLFRRLSPFATLALLPLRKNVLLAKMLVPQLPGKALRPLFEDARAG